MALREELEAQGVWLFNHRSLLPVLIIFVGLGQYIYSVLNPDSFCLRNTPYEIYYELGCLFITLMGLAIRIYTVSHTGVNSSGRNIEGQVAQSLNKTGIYSIVRHPLYLGNFMMWLGPALLPGSLWFAIAFILFYWLYYERIMYAEEQFLERKFGAEYSEWAAMVPAFIPNFKLFIRPHFPFSWKRALKSEKNGLLALFVVFTFFNLLKGVLNKSNSFNIVLIVLTIISLLLYIVVKVIQKRSTCLNDEKKRT